MNDVNTTTVPTFSTINTSTSLDILCQPEFDLVSINIPCSLGIYYYPITMADVNGDNQVDLIFYCQSNPTLNILLGNSYNGTFKELISYPFENVGSVYFIMVADMNNDANVDLILSYYGPDLSHILIVFRNNNGTFQIDNMQSIPIASDPSYIAIVDINKDKNLDIILAIDNDGIYIFLGNGNGTLLPPLTLKLQYSTSLRGLVVNDINNDGYLDIATFNLRDVHFHIFFGHDNGSYWTYKWFFTTTDGDEFTMVSGDFDNNNQTDIVLLTAVTNISTLLYRYNNNTFHTDKQVFMKYNGWGFGAVAVGDLNGDHNLDIVTSMKGTTDIFTFLGNGNRNFQAQNLTSSAPMGMWLWNDIVDFNNDNCQDIININIAVGIIDIFLNTCRCYTHT